MSAAVIVHLSDIRIELHVTHVTDLREEDSTDSAETDRNSMAASDEQADMEADSEVVFCPGAGSNVDEAETLTLVTAVRLQFLAILTRGNMSWNFVSLLIDWHDLHVHGVLFLFRMIRIVRMQTSHRHADTQGLVLGGSEQQTQPYQLCSNTVLNKVMLST